MLTLLKPYGSIEMEKQLFGDLVHVVGIKEAEGPEREAEIREKLRSCDILQADVDIAVNKELICEAKNLRAVLCTSIGVDYVNIKELTELGIPVANNPDFCIEAVAEFTIGLMFSIVRQIPRAAAGAANDNWAIRRFTGGVELQGKTMGIIGFGRIGREVARMAKALGMKVVVYNSHVKPEIGKAWGVELLDLETLCRRADVVSIHAPLNDETRNLIDGRFLAAMKDGAYIINVSRGGILAEEDLAKAVESGKLAGVALDVLEEEPPKAEHPLLQLQDKNVVITPHTAWNTYEAEQKADAHFAKQLKAVSEGLLPPSLLNQEVCSHPRVKKWFTL